MIIQCPSCNTKFAIDSSSVDGLDEPRFHCSRCDHVFGFDEATPSLRPITSSTNSASTPALPIAQAPSSLQTTPHTLSSNSGSSDSGQKQLPLTTRALQIPAPLGARTPVTAPHEAADSYPIGQKNSWSSHDAPPFPNDDDAGAALHEDDGSFDFHAAEPSAAPTIEPIPSSALAFLRGESPTGAPGGLSTDELSTTGELRNDLASREQTNATSRPPVHTSDFGRSGLIDTLELPPDFEPIDPGRPERRSIGDSLTQAVRSFPLLLAPALALGRGKTNSGAESSESNWRNFSIFSLVIGGFLGILGLLAVLAWSAPNTCAELSKILFPAAPQIAPPGLFIRNARFKSMALDSGESVSVISGTIENDSTVPFNDVIVEGILFDGGGKPILTTRISVTSPLSKGRIRSLSPELIQHSQRLAAPSDFSLRVGDQQDFAVVLNDGAPAQQMNAARFYSARVYSVRY